MEAVPVAVEDGVGIVTVLELHMNLRNPGYADSIWSFLAQRWYVR